MKPGRVEMAHRGTLFLDEISELDLSLQSKLLQLLQDGQFCRIGAQEDKKVEVRVVCATNRNLESEIEAGTFRQDRWIRLLPDGHEDRRDGQFDRQSEPQSLALHELWALVRVLHQHRLDAAHPPALDLPP